MDLNMMTFFGSRERALDEWEKIVREADPRLEMRVYELNPGYVLDIYWRTE